MKETFDRQEGIAELAISVTNELVRCACSHCIDIYMRGEEEHFSSKTEMNEIQTKNASIGTGIEKQIIKAEKKV